MKWRTDKRRVSAVTVLAGLVLLLVPALAFMQYQWLGQLSEAERERMQRTLRTAAAQFAVEFDTVLSRALVSLQIDGQSIRDENWTGYAQKYSAWTAGASEPRLVRDVLLVDTVAGTELPLLEVAESIPVDKLRIRRWNNQTISFEPAEWTPDLAKVRESLASHFIGFQVRASGVSTSPGAGDRGRRDGTFALSVGDDNILIAPVTLVELPDGRRRPPKITVVGFTLVRLDPAVMRDPLLASLTARHFHAEDEGVDYRVAVVDRNDPSRVIWESEPGIAPSIVSSPDVTQHFMAPRPDQMFIFARGGGPRERPGGPPPLPPPPPAPGQEKKVVVSVIEREDRSGRMLARTGPLTPFDGRWALVAQHRAGSLEAAVAAVRKRNLILSSSILLLLTMAVGLIIVSSRRAQELARQQMEFVAAVSHELRTPVSVIGAAAGNLADGVVGDPQRVRKYGETIQGEARRLAETVERVLQLAGIAAGRAAAAPAPIHPAELINDSLGACRAEIETAGVTVETEVSDTIPYVLGDATALRSALQNLISNAVKYGGDARWIRVTARPSGTAGHTADGVRFTVEDRGLGIDPDDRKHIFEPFYRGRDAVSKQIHGSGLGLNLVHRIAEAHGGRVTVSSEPGKGSVFTLSLPAAPDQPAAGAERSLASAHPDLVG